MYIACLWIFTIIGASTALLLAELLLRYDRKTGYWLYKNAPDQQTGLRRATLFYRIFGIAVAVGPWVADVAVTR